MPQEAPAPQAALELLLRLNVVLRAPIFASPASQEREAINGHVLALMEVIDNAGDHMVAAARLQAA